MTIDLDSITRKVDVDNRIPLRYYYRIADNLLKQVLLLLLFRFQSIIPQLR